MAKLNGITEIDLQKRELGYCKRSKTFHGFASDFSDKNMMSRIYDDACDEGFYLLNSKTGNKIMFVYEGDDYNQEGEITAFMFTAYCLNENPENLLDLRVCLYND